MITIRHSTDNPKWLDSRMFCPPSNGSEKFHVLYLHMEDITSVGLATWMPNDGYKDGRWQDVTCMNGNPVSDAQVLCWRQTPNATVDSAWLEHYEKYKP